MMTSFKSIELHKQTIASTNAVTPPTKRTGAKILTPPKQTVMPSKPTTIANLMTSTKPTTSAKQATCTTVKPTTSAKPTSPAKFKTPSRPQLTPFKIMTSSKIMASSKPCTSTKTKVSAKPKASADRAKPLLNSSMSRYLQHTASDPSMPQPKSMTRPKTWTDEVEEAYRFQLAGYKGEQEYLAVHRISSEGIDRWPLNGYVKKLQRKDGCFYYYNRARECSDKDVHKCKLYAY